MKYIPPDFKKLSEMSFIDVCRLTEDEARIILENIRWCEKPVCSHCGSFNVTRLKSDVKKSTRDGLFQCNESKCRGQFTVLKGTIMEDSHITLRQWLQAFYSMCSHKKAVSSLQLQKNLGLGSYQSALRLTHRIRLAMKNDPLVGLLKGVVEVDETYIGRKPRKGNGKINKRGRGTEKAPVMALIERKGNSVSMPIEKVNAKTLKTVIREMVDKNSTIMTDEWKSYTGIGKEFAGGHGAINHGLGQYVNGDISTNTAESYFALLKHGVYGTFHHISRQHLHRYCDEFSFRWNNRKVTDGERTMQAIKGIEGKRLIYRGM